MSSASIPTTKGTARVQDSHAWKRVRRAVRSPKGTLLLLFVLAGIVQGTLSGDVGGMLRRMALELPVSVLGMVWLWRDTTDVPRMAEHSAATFFYVLPSLPKTSVYT